MSKFAISGLYAVTPDEHDTDVLAEKVLRALEGGARAVQYRNKTADTPMRYAQALGLLALCRPRNVPLIINDHLDIAVAIDADGVHLGAEDGDIVAARRALGPDKLLGVSCYNRLELAVKAREAGADYVAFGAAFASTTKPGAVVAPLDLYARAAIKLDIPVVAIGGITPANARELIEAGVDAVAIITGLFNATNIAAKARNFTTLFKSTTT